MRACHEGLWAPNSLKAAIEAAVAYFGEVRALVSIGVDVGARKVADDE